MRRNRLPAQAYADGILAGDRLMLSRAITLVESTLVDDAALASQVVDLVLPATGNALRLGITGVPGVGKSSFIEAFGTFITQIARKKLAVLAIDPTSRRSGGSILGDKTRMENLSTNPDAYIRPSAAGNTLGGTAARTREAMLLCEAAGFNIIIIETVGVGQSETGVRDMVDFFLLLMLAGAGDELQGIKRGIMEMADGLVITKADGDNKIAAERAKIEYQNAMHLFPASASGWIPEVGICSALKSTGLEDLWKTITRFHQLVLNNNYLVTLRQQQELSWFKSSISILLEQNFFANPIVNSTLPILEQKILQKEISAVAAARQLFSLAKGNRECK